MIECQKKLKFSSLEAAVRRPLPYRSQAVRGSISIPADDTNRHKRAVFAALSDMESRFEDAGITEADYLAMVRAEFSVASLSELSESMWARLSATLNACRRDPDMFNRLVAKVKAHIPVTDASPIIFADPEDTFSDTCFVIRRHRSTGEEKVLFIGELSDDVRKRCQSHADKSRCIVFLYHAGQKPQPFYPSLSCSPV